jgi:hypothetical protein
MRPTIMPAPSPKGTNFESLYLLRLPRGTDPKLALDAALKAKARDEDPDQNLGRLRQKLEAFLAQALPEDSYGAAMDLLNEHLPGGKVYGDPVDDEEQPEHKYPDREQMRKYLEGMGFADDDIEATLEKMPRNAHEGGMGGAVEDRRRGARDRRAMAGDSAEASFEKMFGTSRIKLG